MPKSKRNKQIELAKTKKRGLEWKKKLFESIRSSVDTYSNVFIFSVADMRNSKMKKVREDSQWKDSRFFIGKNKIMAMALGKCPEDEYKPNLHKIGQRIKGERALLFSNRSPEDVLSWFRSYSEADFARSGNKATEDVKLLEGPLPDLPHSLEPYLRQDLELPTSLVKGVIHLVKDHQVCKEGGILTPKAAKILKILGYQMAEFHVTINCMWSQDGTFFQYVSDDESDMQKNKTTSKGKLNSTAGLENSSCTEIKEMEVDDDEMPYTLEVPELVEPETNAPDMSVLKDKIESSPAKSLDSATNTSTPKDKTANTIENGQNLQENGMKILEGTPVMRAKKARKLPVKDTLLMTPDIANSSQESPVFRELRSRSVKMNRKRK